MTIKITKRETLLALALVLVLLAHGAAAPSAVSAQTTAKWCADTKLVLFPGGSPGGPFETVVYNGALQAAADLGANVQYVWSDWQPDKMVSQFKEAAATKPDGIGVMGHPGDDAFKPVIDDAIKAGILVTSSNTTLDKIEAIYKGSGFGYVGAELYAAGQALAKEAVKRFGFKKGDRAFVAGLLSQPTRGLRTKGVIDALKEAGMEVDYQEIDPAWNADATQGTVKVTAYISSHPDVKLIVTDHGNSTQNLDSYLKAANKKAGDIKTAGFDLAGKTVDGIKGGWISLVIDQQQWLQGYMSILQLCLTKKYGFSGLHIDTGAGFASADNVDRLADLVKKGIR
jgi:simple sugar transport system substrate-binding protein